MNKLITTLAHRANLNWCIQNPWDQENLQLFADLLIKEVIDKIEEVGYKASNNISAEDTELFVSVLKMHFGVKE
jgi:hypothetical protein